MQFKPKYYIYTLKLLNDKWYVGYTKDLVHRFKQHVNGKGSIITKYHKPIGTPSFYESSATSCRMAEIEEYNQVIIMMEKYGYKNVFGSIFLSGAIPDSKFNRSALRILRNNHGFVIPEIDDDLDMNPQTVNLHSYATKDKTKFDGFKMKGTTNWKKIPKNKVKDCSPVVFDRIKSRPTTYDNSNTYDIYVYRLNGGKFQVAKTLNKEDFLLRYVEKDYIYKFAKKHGVVELVHITKGNNEMVDKITERLMVKYGWQNVRGGTYTYGSINIKPEFIP